MTTRMRLQRGATLLIALIMLVLLTLFAISAFNTGTTNLKVVGNMQARSEALNVSQQAIETVISTPLFIASPANAVPNPCGAPNTLCTDIAGTGVTEYTTKLNPQPSCVMIAPIKNEQLNLTNPEDLGCAAGQLQQFGVAGAVSGNSLCANTVWEITAETTGAATGAKVKVTQGVGVKVGIDDTSTCL
jgi:Tfp pilus assembly protein PilX